MQIALSKNGKSFTDVNWMLNTGKLNKIVHWLLSIKKKLNEWYYVAASS